MNENTNNTMTNKQIQEALINISLYLGNISVSGNDVFTMAECRNALKQLASAIIIEEGQNNLEA